MRLLAGDTMGGYSIPPFPPSTVDMSTHAGIIEYITAASNRDPGAASPGVQMSKSGSQSPVSQPAVTSVKVGRRGDDADGVEESKSGAQSPTAVPAGKRRKVRRSVEDEAEEDEDVASGVEESKSGAESATPHPAVKSRKVRRIVEDDEEAGAGAEDATGASQLTLSTAPTAAGLVSFSFFSFRLFPRPFSPCTLFYFSFLYFILSCSNWRRHKSSSCETCQQGWGWWWETAGCVGDAGYGTAEVGGQGH